MRHHACHLVLYDALFSAVDVEAVGPHPCECLRGGSGGLVDSSTRLPAGAPPGIRDQGTPELKPCITYPTHVNNADNTHIGTCITHAQMISLCTALTLAAQTALMPVMHHASRGIHVAVPEHVRDLTVYTWEILCHCLQEHAFQYFSRRYAIDILSYSGAGKDLYHTLWQVSTCGTRVMWDR